MKDYQVSNHNLDVFFHDLQSEINKNKLIIVSTQVAGSGKWGMARLWRKWMATTADFMAKNGVTMPLMYDRTGKPFGVRTFNANDAHELFTSQHMGLDENGKRLSWSKSTNGSSENTERQATKGERFNALRKHEVWCVDRGITLFKPRDSEYSKLLEAENE